MRAALMRHPLRALALACALTLTPACAALHPSGPEIVNPISVTPDQRAYALLGSYAALIETATGIVRDAAVPIEVKRALGRAEAAATPTVHTLEIAFAAYLRTRAGFEGASDGSQSAVARATAALNAAAQALSQAIDAAQAPITELQALVSAQHGGAAR
jgi:hypothetical protein